MRKIFLILIIGVVFILAMSAVSAKEDAHFDVEKDSSGYSTIISLKDSNNNPIPNVKFSINITKPNGYLKKFPTKSLNKTGQSIYFLGSNKGNYVISVFFKGNDQYNPCSLTKTIAVTAGNGGDSPYNYYDTHNYGNDLKVDEFIYDNYYYEDIYDNPSDFDGEWY